MYVFQKLSFDIKVLAWLAAVRQVYSKSVSSGLASYKINLVASSGAAAQCEPEQ